MIVFPRESHRASAAACGSTAACTSLGASGHNSSATVRKCLPCLQYHSIVELKAEQHLPRQTQDGHTKVGTT